MSNEGWFPDPARHHELRYFDGASWTDRVYDRGSYAVAPLGTAPPTWFPPVLPTPPTPQPAGTTGLVVGVVAAVLVGLLAVGGLVFYVVASGRSTRTHHASSPAPTTTAAPSRSPGPPQPALKSRPPLSVLGPTWAAGEATYTMSFPGWPFAFRVPATWGCLRGSVDAIPGAAAYVCVDEAHPESQQRANVMFRRCPTSCTAAEQLAMKAQWFDEPGRTPTARDATTAYLETPRDAKGVYSLDMSHFFGPAPDAPLRWQVGIFVSSPTQTKADVQKIVNDVRSQTP